MNWEQEIATAEQVGKFTVGNVIDALDIGGEFARAVTANDTTKASILLRAMRSRKWN